MSSPLVLALLADARLPTGSHAQSAGLEALVQSGLGADAIPDLARGRLRTVTATEAGAAVVARHVHLTGDRPRLGSGLDAVSAAWAARTPSQHLRESADRVGRGYARVALRLWGLDLGARHPRPVVLGAIAAATGIGAADLARLVAYDDVQTIAAAALKLLPLDPLETAGWVLEVAPDIEALVDSVAGLTDPDDIPAAGAPRLDHLIGIHAHAPRRLFHA